MSVQPASAEPPAASPADVAAIVAPHAGLPTRTPPPGGWADPGRHHLGHLDAADHVEDILDAVGPCPRPHERPIVTISLCDLPADRQRAAFQKLMAWDLARVTLRGGRGDRALVRFEDKPQLTVSFLIEAVCTQVEGDPQRTFVWAVRDELMPS